MSYGPISTGFARKPLSAILAEIESLLITEYGQGVIQTSQSPLGQLNGLFANLAAILWEEFENCYQSYDPDQAEGTRLAMLGRIRLLSQGLLTDDQYRQAITNASESRVNLRDISYAIAGLDGVTFSHVFVNETGETTGYTFERATIVVAVEGGDDSEIANILWNYITPGISTYGNYRIDANIDGFCRSFSIIRPIDVPVTITINVRVFADSMGCPAPSATVIRDTFISEWNTIRLNGKDVNDYTVRSIIERVFTNVAFVNLEGSRDGETASGQVVIGFIEMASFASNNVTVNFVTEVTEE